jgi:hypothetical protein
MKTFLLIWMISLHNGQQPTVQKLEQPDIPSCQAQAKAVHQQLDDHGCDKYMRQGAIGCSPAYIVRTSCVTGAP